MTSWMLTIRSISVITFIVSLFWIIIYPGFEPLTVFFASIATLAAHFSFQNSKYQRHLDQILFVIIIIIATVIVTLEVSSYFQKNNVSFVSTNLSKLDPNDNTIIVAEFDGPDPEKYRLTEVIINRLRSATTNYEDIEIVSLGYAISELDGSAKAREIGEKLQADMVIWGWYGVTDERVPISINIEMTSALSSAINPDLANTCNISINQLRNASIMDLQNISLQTQLSEELTAATLFPLGVAALLNGDYELSISYFDDILAQIGGPKNFETVSTQVTKTSEKLVDESLVLFMRAEAKRESKNFESSIDDYSTIVNIDKNNIFVYLTRAQTYTDMHLYSEAISDYSQAISLQGESVNSSALYRRGVVYELIGDLDKAIKDYDAALTLNSKQISLHLLQQWEDDNLEVSEAIQIYQKAINQRSDNILAYFAQGLAHLRFDTDPFAALPLLSNVILLNPNIEEAYALRASLYEKQGKDNLALADYDMALSLDPDNSPCNYLRRASLNKAMGNQLKYHSDLQKAKTVSDNLINKYKRTPVDDILELAHYYVVRGKAYIALGNKELGVIDLKKALEILPDFPKKDEIQLIINENSGQNQPFAWIATTIFFIISLCAVFHHSFIRSNLWQQLERQNEKVDSSDTGYLGLSRLVEESAQVFITPTSPVISQFEVMLSIYKKTKEYDKAHEMISQHFDESLNIQEINLVFDFYQELYSQSDVELAEAGLSKNEIEIVLNKLRQMTIDSSRA